MSPLQLRDIAERAARAGADALARLRGRPREVRSKGEGVGNLVTDADLASEAAILSVLKAEVPTHAVLAEESGAAGVGAFRWFIDPLDGTTNYAHDIPHYCCSVAVEGPWETGRALLAAAIVDPVRGECFLGAKGQGATLDGAPMVTAQEQVLDRALLCTGFPYGLKSSPDAPLGLFVRLVTHAQGIRRTGSAALDLAYVAAGRFDGFFEFGLMPWDTAAGALLVSEAGGWVGCLDGSPFDVLVGDIVAASGQLAPALVQETKAFAAHIGWSPRRFGHER